VKALVKAGVVGATGFEPVTSSVSDPTSPYRSVHPEGWRPGRIIGKPQVSAAVSTRAL
jgi:hypothetical protein